MTDREQMRWINSLPGGVRFKTLRAFRAARKANRDEALAKLRAGDLDLAQAIEVVVIGEREWWDPSVPS